MLYFPPFFYANLSDFGGKDSSKLFGDTGNISGCPKHNLLCRLNTKFKHGNHD